MRDELPTDNRVVKRMSSGLLHSPHKLTCFTPSLQLKAPKMFRLCFQI